MKKNLPKESDSVEILYNSNKYIGILMPSPNKNITILKLSSGYNLGLEKKAIKSIKLVEKQKEKRSAMEEKLEINKNLPTISILHTGGTIASKVDYRTGGVVSKFTPQDLVNMFPELRNIANIRSKLIREMWSDDLRFKHFELIAKEIEKEIKNKADGIIVSMGTDNLAVASSALSFIMEKCPVPILFVGAQRSSDRGSSDAGMNLICAAKFIVKTNFAGVAICMHGTESDTECWIMPATKTRKLHTSRRDAFRVVNDTPIAKVSYNTDNIEFLKTNYGKRGKELLVKPNMEEKVGLLKIVVNMFAKQFEFFKGYKGLVIEGTGLGHIPLEVIDEYTKEHKKIKEALKRLIKSGTVIVMTSQCLFGRVNMNVYSKGRDLQALGAISGEDMLPETAFVKLSWLLANYKKDAKNLINKNLRGEISEKTNNEFL